MVTHARRPSGRSGGAVDSSCDWADDHRRRRRSGDWPSDHRIGHGCRIRDHRPSRARCERGDCGPRDESARRRRGRSRSPGPRSTMDVRIGARSLGTEDAWIRRCRPRQQPCDRLRRGRHERHPCHSDRLGSHPCRRGRDLDEARAPVLVGSGPRKIAVLAVAISLVVRVDGDTIAREQQRDGQVSTS